MIRQSHIEKKFLFLWKALKPDEKIPESEYRFDSKRRWRFDFAFVGEKVAIELEGGIYKMECKICKGSGMIGHSSCSACFGSGLMQGRHTRGSGYKKDCEKYNAAALDGWIVLRFTSQHLDNPKAVCNTIQVALNQRRGYDVERCPECGEGIKVMRWG